MSSSMPEYPQRHCHERWLLGWLALSVGLFFSIWLNGRMARQGSALSSEGSPAPALDADSLTGYERNQRHFLGTFERGETYRWIEYVQNFGRTGFSTPRMTDVDNMPELRPILGSTLYAVWLTGIAKGLELLSNDSFALCVERAAWIDPILTHALSLIGLTLLLRRRVSVGLGIAVIAFWATFPPLYDQFLPGVLGPRNGAMLFALGALILALPSRRTGGGDLSWGSALLVALALALEPSVGVTAMLGVAAMALVYGGGKNGLRWGLGGGSLVLLATVLDQVPWTLHSSELRAAHPLYAVAWIGLGAALTAIHRGAVELRRDRLTAIYGLVACIGIGTTLTFQVWSGYPGWLRPESAWNRLSSQVETAYYGSTLSWLKDAPLWEILILLVPITGAVGALSREMRGGAWRNLAPSRFLLAGVVGMGAVVVGGLYVRSLVPLTLFSFVGLALALDRSERSIRGTFIALGIGVLVLHGWGLAASQSRLALNLKPDSAALSHYQALVNRHLAHWLARHSAPGEVVALAAPEVSDSLIFHGHCRTVMSTAWRAYTGRVAASRLLSAPEESEVEAILSSRGITHIIHVSWDSSLAQMVRIPASAPANTETFLSRLDRWVYPMVLRPLPYILPSDPLLVREKAAVFAVTPVQDEGLQLARLAEYFLEINRAEPAGAVAEVLRQSYRGDVNALIALGLGAASRGDNREQALYVDQLSRYFEKGTVPDEWDRRVQAVILMALGQRHAQAKTTLGQCLSEGSASEVYRLTPLQAFRLATLVRAYGLGSEASALRATLESQMHPFLLAPAISTSRSHP